MHRGTGIWGLALTLVACGCVTTPSPRTTRVPRGQPEPTLQDKLTAAAEAMRQPFQTEKPHDTSVPWDWTTALPIGTSRAELVRATLPGEALAALVPEIARPEIILVSGRTGASAVEVTAVGGKSIKDYNQLDAAASAAAESGKPITVAFRSPSASAGAPPPSVEIKPAALNALCCAVAPQETLLRVTDHGNPWVAIRRGGVRAKVLTRVERRHGLLQVAMTMGVHWGDPLTLPVEIQAQANGKPLPCLGVSEVLDRLYGTPSTPADSDPAAYSFAASSERQDYLIPSNYKRLEQATEGSATTKPAGPSLPALASLPGIVYPGPALLGDARALCGLLLQRQIYRPGDPERTGWILFGDDILRQAASVQLTVDLGTGPIHLAFELPSR